MTKLTRTSLRAATIPVLLISGLGILYGPLIILSLGSGWTFPNLLPDRIDFAPWRNFFSDRDGLFRAMLLSAGLSLCVATQATICGLLFARAVRQTNRMLWRFLIYLPFVVAPVIAGVCLYDLLIRLRLAGTVTGVFLSQSMFATSFAAIYFSELWSPRTDRLEQLVRNLGGTNFDVWRHAVVPQSSGLIVICFVQTGLYSWLDYGLVSIIGGGNVQTLTSRLFGYIREASINQAAQSALVLLLPALVGVAATTAFHLRRPAETARL